MLILWAMQVTGKALLMACMLDMKLKGYGYVIIGMTDLVDFYSRCVGATPIEQCGMSVWKDWVGDDSILLHPPGGEGS